MRWFMRGFAAAVIVCGALNAGSYFVRSQNGGNLVGSAASNREALGFPYASWDRGGINEFGYFSFRAVLWNGIFASVAGTLAGMATAARRDLLRPFCIAYGAAMTARATVPLRFSLRQLLLATAASAVVAELTRQKFLRADELMWSIFIGGPAAIVAVAVLLRHIQTTHRIVILLLTLLALIATAIGVGHAQRPISEFEKVLIGLFVCWTPQWVFFALISALWVERLRRASAGNQ